MVDRIARYVKKPSTTPHAGSEQEQLFRRGFEAALAPDLRGKPLQDAANLLQERFPRVYKEEAFERGYLRAQNYYLTLQKHGDASR